MTNERIRALLIEDNPDDALLMQEALAEAHGGSLELEWVDRLSTGLERLAQGAIDVVLCDLSLPDSQGLEAFAKAHAQAPGVPIVVLTGLDDESVATAALREGAQDYLIKGQVDADLLMRSVRYAIERKRAEDAVRESEARYRTLFEQSKDAIFISRDGRIADANQAALDLFRYTREQALGLDAGDVWIEHADLERMRRDLERYGSVQDFEARFRRRDGTEIDCLLTATLRRDEEGADREIQGIIRDVTERKRVQEALRESNQALAALIQASPLPIMALDRDAKVRMWNPAAERVFGWSEQEVLNRLPPLVPEDKQDEFWGYLERLLRGETLTGLEVRRQRKDESPIDVGIWPAHLRNAEGAISGMMAVIADLTDRKEAEATLRDLAVLEERNRMAREIHDTMAQGFTGIVLQLEAAEQALDETPGEVPVHLGRAKDLARKCLQEARRSVWNLLPRALEERPLDAAIEDAVRQFGSDGPENATFGLSGQKRDLPPDAQTALLRICQESLTNVRRHAGATHVTVKLRFNGDDVSLEVVDNGIGFDSDAERDSSGGGGFGLTGMEQRAALLGGTFNVESRLGEGTLVKVSIPNA